MDQSPNPTDELLALCERLIEGTLSAEEHARLERLVLGSAEARRLYVEYMHQHAALRWQGGALAGAPLADVVHARRPLARRVAYAAALPAMLLAGVLAARVLSGGGARAVATLAAAHGCRWEGGALPTAEGARLGAGRLRLAEGLATLAFDSGAAVTLEAPAELELVSARECVLHRGSIVARVPPPAIGFVVRSATAIVIDHGTEFGVKASDGGETRVEVLSGLVEARHARTSEDVRLHTGEAAVFQPSGLGARGPLAGALEPGALPSGGGASDLVISSALGRGGASYVQSRRHPDDRAPEGVLLVKNTADPEWQRKAYVAFDLAAVAQRPIHEASLALSAVPTGMGFAAFVADATFTVFGIADAPAGLDERTLQWEGAPGNAAGGADVDPARAVRVGSFVVPQGTASGGFGVSGPALVEFLNRARGGVATFLVVRDTPESRGHGLVHGFAGSHHPTAAPPTLRLGLR
jgi:hypothetical protein